MSQNTAFIKQLITLAERELSIDDKDMLSIIIAMLFDDLAIGHSCSVLKDGTSGLCVEDQINLLLKSKLAYEYSGFPRSLKALPISILNIKDRKLVYITKYLQYELDILNRVWYFSKSLLPQADLSIVTTDNIGQYLEKLSMLRHLSTEFNLPNTEQLLAIENSLNQKFSIITGGPGTGKTTTVTILLWLLFQMYGDKLKIKICAPTGRAAKRVKDSIQKSINHLGLKELDFTWVRELLIQENNFLTIHKLLGYQANSIYFKHNKNNLLDLDILIIDESSMVSLPLFSKLLQAIDVDKVKHIILLGDKNQLSSVEEGYVFASLVGATKIERHVTSLVTGNRSNKDIGNLASAVLREDVSKFNQLLNSSGPDNNLTNLKVYNAKLSNLFDKQLFAKLDNSLNRYFKYIAMLDFTDIQKVFEEFNRQIVLCLTNVGLFGTIYLNAQIEKKVKYMLANNKQAKASGAVYDLFSMSDSQVVDISEDSSEWYTGRPIIILENDYNLELFNGDIGICIILEGKPQLVFENGHKFIPEVLPKYQVAYAITIHKAQGSEYEHVNLVLCDNKAIESMNTLLTKELVYTGITRAKTSLSIFAGDKVLAHAISNKTIRNTGLDLML